MKIFKKIFIVLILILVTGCSLTKPKLKDDYYNYINKDIIKNIKLKEDEFTKSTMSIYQDKLNNEVDKLILEMLNNNTNNDMSIFYNKYKNMNDSTNINIINKYINLIDKSNNINEFINNSIIIEKELSIPIFTSYEVMNDLKNTSKNIIYYKPVPLSFLSSTDIYNNSDFLTYKSLIKQYGIKLLKLYGYDTKKAREVSKLVTDLYINISNNSKSSKEFQDINNMYNIITKSDLINIYSNLSPSYFNYLDNNEKISILDIDNYKTINNLLTNDNLYVLKESVKLKILENYSIFLNEDYRKVMNNFTNEQLGIKKDYDINIDSINIIKDIFMNDIDLYYQDKYLDKNKVNYLNKMINEILIYYEKDLENIEWLSKDTRLKAINKLKHIKVNIGLNKENIILKKYNLNKDISLIENIINMNKTDYISELDRLNSNKTNNIISQTTFNAFYNPRDNSINFPVAFVNYIDTNKNYYQNLGSIGMIIAHEITHAFDSNGSLFDEYGNINNWWTKDDKNNFKEKQKLVIDYYDKFEVIDGNYLDGKLTANENIADLGAINTISEIAKEKKATVKEIKLMYKSFAKLWASKSKDEYLKILLLNDNHSPDKFRVIGTLYNTDLFYDTYNIGKNTKYYVSKNNRIRIW